MLSFFYYRISGKTPIEEIVATMKESVDYVSRPPSACIIRLIITLSSGKVKYLGFGRVRARYFTARVQDPTRSTRIE